MQKKIAAFLVLCFVCTLVLTSCFVVEYDDRTGDGQYTKETETQEAHKEPPETFAPQVNEIEQAEKKMENVLKALYTKELDKKILSLVIVSDKESIITAEPENVYSKVFAMQLQFIKNITGCTIGVSYKSVDTFLEEANAAKKAGIIYADLVYVPQKTVGNLVSDGLVYDLNELYGSLLGGEGIFESSTEAAGVGGAVYAVAGTACYSPSSVACLAFNKSITDKADLTSLIYESVKNDSWSAERFNSVCNEALKKKEGVVKISAVTKDYFIDSFFGGFGVTPIINNVLTAPTLDTKSQRMDEALGVLRGFLNDGDSVFFGENAKEKFVREEAVFYVGMFDEITKLVGNIGIVPLPKIDSSVKGYNSYTDGDASVFAVLNTVQEVDYPLMMIRLLNGTGDVVYDLLVRELTDSVLSDTYSANNIRSILYGAKYDFASVFGGYYQSVNKCTVEAVRYAVKNNKSYADSVKSYVESFNRDMTALYSKSKG